MKTTDAQALARSLMDEHGLGNWEFTFDKATRRFGATHGSRKRISLSRELTELNDEAEVRKTIMHEIAHALTPRDRGHGRQWKSKMIALGQAPDTYYSKSVVQPKALYTTECPNGHEGTANRNRRAACYYCCKEHNNGKYHEAYKLTYRRNR